MLSIIKEEYYRINPKGCSDFFKKRDKRIPCLPTLRKRFGKTYNEILIMAGIPDEELNFVRRTPQSYLEKLIEVSNEFGYVPSQNKFREMGFTPSILIREFGSYSEAVKHTNLSNRQYKSPIKVQETNEELLEMYKRFSKKIGRPASSSDLIASEEIYNPNIFAIRFGGMKGLKEKAGYPIIDKNNDKYSKGQIKDVLKDLYLSNGGRLSVKELIVHPSLPSYATILRYFKTTKITEVWNEIEKELLHEKSGDKIA